MNSKAKGARGERELSNKLKEYGYDCRRGQQYCGANGDADVVGLDGIHIEVKRTERLNLQDAMSQAIGDSKDGEFPAVFHRRNNDNWKVTMLLADWIKLYNEWRPPNRQRRKWNEQIQVECSLIIGSLKNARASTTECAVSAESADEFLKMD